MALNTPYKRVDLNVNPNYASMAQKDPWFAIGYALGEGYWNNYNARGEKKALETGMQELKDFGNSEGNYVLNNPDLLAKYARPDRKQQAVESALGGKSSSKLQNGKTPQQPQSLTEYDKGLMKWDYMQGKYKDSANPVGDSIADKSIVSSVELGLSNIDNMGAFDEAVFWHNLDQKLIADGRNAKQREYVREKLQPLINSKKVEYNNKVSNELYGLYQQAEAAGDNGSADQFLTKIASINPNMAKVIMDGRVTAKDRFKAKEAREIAAIKAAGKGGNGKGGKSGKGNFLNPTNNDDLKLALTIVQNPDNFTKEQVANAQMDIDFAQKWKMKGLDLDNAADVADYLDAVSSMSGTDLEKAQKLQRDGFISRHPYARELMQEYGLYAPSDFGEGGSWVSSGSDEELSEQDEQQGVLGPVAEEQKLKLTAPAKEDSVVKTFEAYTKNGRTNMAKMVKDLDKK